MGKKNSKVSAIVILFSIYLVTNSFWFVTTNSFVYILTFLSDGKQDGELKVDCYEMYYIK